MGATGWIARVCTAGAGAAAARALGVKGRAAGTLDGGRTGARGFGTGIAFSAGAAAAGAGAAAAGAGAAARLRPGP